MSEGTVPEIEINVSDEVCKKLKELAEEGGFDSVEELIMRLILDAIEENKEENEEIKERLKSLGYM